MGSRDPAVFCEVTSIPLLGVGALVFKLIVLEILHHNLCTEYIKLI